MRKSCSIILGITMILGAAAGLIDLTSFNARGTDVSGIISANTTWDTGGSPYIVVGSVEVNADVTLTITPGVVVKFDGPYILNVQGNLSAVGNQAERIIFTSNKASPAPGNWGQIQIYSQGHVDIQYSDIMYSEHGLSLIQSSNNIVKNNNMSYNSWYGIELSASSNNTVENNKLFSNEVSGISLASSSHNNHIAGNEISTITGGGISVGSSSNNTIEHNTILSADDPAISLGYAVDNRIMNNTVLSSAYEVITIFYSSSNNLIAYNRVSKSGSDTGYNFNIRYSSDHNIITKNTITTVGGRNFDVWLSLGNRIFHNNIVGAQGHQVHDDKEHGTIWNDTYPSGGNYWSDWGPKCKDLYSGSTSPQTSGSPDGICDNFYHINQDVRDHFPFKSPIDTGAAFDAIPPTVTDLRPADGSNTNDNKPRIGANYSDASGIDTSSVVLKVDDIDVTDQATVTESGVSYTPTSELTSYIGHRAYLEVSDNEGNTNIVTWSFTTGSGNTGFPNPFGSFLSQFWWILLILIVIIITVVVLILLLTRRKKGEPEPAPPPEPPFLGTYPITSIPPQETESPPRLQPPGSPPSPPSP